MKRDAERGALTIIQAFDDPNLFGRWFQGGSWRAWRAFLAALFGLPMADDLAAIGVACTGLTRLPEAPAREGWVVVGRRGGKSRIAAAVAVYLAAARDYAAILAPGERGVVMLIAADRRQARVAMRYVRGLLEGSALLAGMIDGEPTQDSVRLTNGVDIEIHTASYRTTRGYTIVGAVCDEIAYWRSDDAANPDTEILAALRPGMATVPGSLLLCIGSPYARRGALWEAYRKHFGRDGAPVLVWQAPTSTMNPGVDGATIAEAYEADAAAARSEYGALFRTDLEDFVPREVVEPLVATGRRSLAPVWSRRYVAFVDPAGGSGSDSMTLAVAHIDHRGLAVLDLLMEARPPFSPEETTAAFCAALTPYEVRRVTGDRYGGDWPAAAFRRNRIAYEPAERTKSEIYLALLPLLTSGSVELLDEPRLVAQLLALERRTAWGGRDSVDHPRGGHDDLANVAAGALVTASGSRRGGEGAASARGRAASGRLQRPHAGRRDPPDPRILTAR